MSTPGTEEIRDLVAEGLDQMVDIRRELHQHPELSFDETATTELIDGACGALGLTRGFCPTPTGAVWTLDGGRPGKTVIIRADIDALPIVEEADLPFASATEGVMHACGHDAHVAQAIGAARALSRRAEDLPGRYVFLFQPAEEGLGGAERMIEGGVLDDLDASAVIGCHVASSVPAGLVGVRPGVTMADVYSLQIDIAGIGGHGAAYTNGANPLLAGALLATRLDSVVATMSLEGTDCACTAGVLQAGTAPNVIPSHAVLKGTLRTFTPEQTAGALANMDQLLAELTAETGCTFALQTTDHAPAVTNDPGMTDLVRGIAEGVVGESSVLHMPPVSPSDDVSFFLDRIPGCYFFVGAGLADGSSGMHHNPGFAIDEACMPIAASVLAAAAVAAAGR